MDAILKINNDYSYFVTTDQNVRNLFWTKLRFRKKGYFHTRAYKQGIWDGFIDFFNKKTGRFLTGLLPEVRLVLNHFNIPYKVLDERVITNFTQDSIKDDFLYSEDNPITLYDYQVDLVNQSIKHKRGIIQAPTSSGKAQPLDAIVYTPDGPKNMGEIVIGDQVCTPEYSCAPVIGIFPQGPKPVYEITFTNGDKVQCCKEHLWKIDCHVNKWQDKIKDTQYIISKLKNKDGRNILSIKFSKPVFFNKKKIRIHPYLMGVFIGDGSLTNNSKFTNTDSEIVEKIRSLIKKGYVLHRDESLSEDYSIKKEVRGSRYNFYTDMLRYYGLFGKRAWEKFIPDQYKYNSYKVRMNLLNGLLDTDGYINEKGAIEYTTTSKVLANDVKTLVESLGGCCRIRDKIPTYTYKDNLLEGKMSYTTTIFFTKNPKSLKPISRKFNRLSKRKNINGRIIESIKFVGIKHCQCILIDHPNHLYLTNNFVPTHNTEVMIAIMKALPPNTPTLFIANRKSLIEQNYKRMMQWGFKNVGRFYSNYHEPNIITCATVQSAHHLDKLLPEIKAVIADEIHMLSNDTGIGTFKKLKGASIRLAVSATPFKHGGKDDVQKYAIKGYFGPIFKIKVVESGILTTNFLQERGTVSDSICTFYKVTEPKIPYDIYIDAVTNGIATNTEFHRMVARLTSKLKGRTLILVERVIHGDILNKLIPNSLWVYGKDDMATRAHVIEQMQKAQGNVIAIATQGIFSVGINFFIHNLINAAGGKAEHDIIQRMGRGLRTARDKEILNYYDFIFEINPYLDDHSHQRVKVLRKEKHEVIIKNEIDF